MLAFLFFRMARTFFPTLVGTRLLPQFRGPSRSRFHGVHEGGAQTAVLQGVQAGHGRAAGAGDHVFEDPGVQAGLQQHLRAAERSVSGADAVAHRYRVDAASFQSGGTSVLEILQKEVSGDLAFWNGFQVARVRIRGQDKPVDMRIRETETFRRTGGEWKLIHRHADLPTTRVANQFEGPFQM